jgi:hypothetical protein
VPSDEPDSHLSSRHGHIKGATFDSTAPPLQGDRVQFHLFITAILGCHHLHPDVGRRRSHADSKHRPRCVSNLRQGGHSRCDRTSSNPFHYNATYISMCGLRGGQNNLRPALDCAAGLDAPKGARPLRLWAKGPSAAGATRRPTRHRWAHRQFSSRDYLPEFRSGSVADVTACHRVRQRALC